MDSRDAVVQYLARRPREHVMHLKMLGQLGAVVESHHVQDGSGEGALLWFPADALSYDGHTYPDFAFIAMPVADSPALFRLLLDAVPRGRVVFKLNSESDAALTAETYPCQRLRVFLNFTSPSDARYRAHADVQTSTELDAGLIAAYGQNGYGRSELEQLFARGAEALQISPGGDPVSFGMVYPNFENLWEIAGLYTEPSARRKGLSARIVETALARLLERGRIPRYIVDAANDPSIALARGLGLQEFMRIVHLGASTSGSAATR